MLMAARFPPTLRCVALSAVCRLTITSTPERTGTWTAHDSVLGPKTSYSSLPDVGVMALISQGVSIHRKAAPLKVGGDSRKNPVEQLQRTV